MHLKQHTVEEEAVSGGPAGRVPGQAGEDELLGCGEGAAVGGAPPLWPHCVRRSLPTPWEPSWSNVQRVEESR